MAIACVLKIMTTQPARSFKASFFCCVALALFAAGCVVYPDGTAVLLPPPLVVTTPVYAYGGGYSGYYRPYYGYRGYGYRPSYWGGYRGGYGGYYRGGGYRGGYCRGGYWR